MCAFFSFDKDFFLRKVLLNMQNAIVTQIFDSFQGNWQINRLFTSKLIDYPSGSSQGNAKFQIKEPKKGKF